MEEGGPEEMAPTVSSREDYETEHHVVSVVEAAVREDWKEVLSFLANKESEALPLLVADREGGNLHLRTAREAEVEWVVLSSARHGFSTVTAVLAMSYFDWCFLPCADGRRGPLMRIQGDKPWMGRLAAVVCMSLAIKVEETSVPLLLDLQVPPPLPVAVSSTEESGFLFEPMIVRRMELLVLSSLEWKMNPVTPLSFIHHLLPRLYSGGGFAARIRELAKRSGEALLYTGNEFDIRHRCGRRWICSTRWSRKRPTTSFLSSNPPRLIFFENLERCYHLMAESMSATNATGHKLKHSSLSSPASPRGVVGSCFSNESSCGSWSLWPPLDSLSPEAATAAAPLKHRKHSNSKEQF
ncbi:hypothetical protein ZIOFF_026013 [Zingiber officinale]|uniref:Cyclin N-terminal domain-containing protein n=1 Tax=Zingiber officinale TaxID=94328 RepID=A0A8J5LF24_ZINOF|nr:hypothetical protein ZIOFF_026013 [Zingiber officinale]